MYYYSLLLPITLNKYSIAIIATFNNTFEVLDMC